jgi:RHS repeat-associated protein
VGTLGGGTTATAYVYNGLGDKIEQWQDLWMTRYTLDLASGLTQILASSNTQYLYGYTRLGQQAGGEMEFFLTDASGSVRQLANDTSIILTKEYEPYGEVLAEEGSVSSYYGYGGEWTSPYNELVYLRARWYSPAMSRFFTTDPWTGDIFAPISFNKYAYTYSNPINLTDPSGENPFTYCFTVFAALALADGPLPAGDTAGALACIYIFGATTLAAIYADQIAPDVAYSIENLVNSCPIPDVVTTPGIWDQDSTLQRENPFAGPQIWPTPKPNPTPNPFPSPQPIPFPYYPPTTTTPQPTHNFYYFEYGKYASPGRSTTDIIRDLKSYSYIQGVSGAIGQLKMKQMNNNVLMGRKFEAEIALYFAYYGNLAEMNSTSQFHDLVVTNVDPIKYIEVKWSNEAIKRNTLYDVVRDAKLHETFTFMLVTTWITQADQFYLQENGGIKYP